MITNSSKNYNYTPSQLSQSKEEAKSISDLKMNIPIQNTTFWPSLNSPENSQINNFICSIATLGQIIKHLLPAFFSADNESFILEFSSITHGFIQFLELYQLFATYKMSYHKSLIHNWESSSVISKYEHW